MHINRFFLLAMVISSNTSVAMDVNLQAAVSHAPQNGWLPAQPELVYQLIPLIADGVIIDQACDNVRSFYQVRKLYQEFARDERASGELIEHLANRFKKNPAEVVAHLRTKGAFAWYKTVRSKIYETPYNHNAQCDRVTTLLSLYKKSKQLMYSYPTIALSQFLQLLHQEHSIDYPYIACDDPLHQLIANEPPVSENIMIFCSLNTPSSWKIIMRNLHMGSDSTYASWVYDIFSGMPNIGNKECILRFLYLAKKNKGRILANDVFSACIGSNFALKDPEFMRNMAAMMADHPIVMAVSQAISSR